jgi:hypothetical protein
LLPLRQTLPELICFLDRIGRQSRLEIREAHLRKARDTDYRRFCHRIAPVSLSAAIFSQS